MIEMLLEFLEWSGYFWTVACLLGAGAAWWYLPAPLSRPIVSVLLCIAAGSYLLRHAYSNGVEHERTKWETALEREKDRRNDELTKVQMRYIEKARELVAMEVENEKLRKRLATTVPPLVVRACLDVDSVRRLQKF